MGQAGAKPEGGAVSIFEISQRIRSQTCFDESENLLCDIFGWKHASGFLEIDDKET